MTKSLSIYKITKLSEIMITVVLWNEYFKQTLFVREWNLENTCIPSNVISMEWLLSCTTVHAKRM